nr:hypothetical protein [Tanacetum cinerariifolium]
MLHDSNPIFDLRPTLAEYKSEWWTSTIDFLKVVKDSITKELNSRIFKLEAIIQAFLKLFESSIIDSVGTLLDADTQEEFDEDYLVEEEFIRRLKEEERLLLEEERLNEEEIRVRLEEQKWLRLEEDRALEVKKKWEEDYRKRSYAFMNSDHMKQAMACCIPSKRSHSVAIRIDSWFKGCSKFDKKKESFGLIDRDMTEFLKNVKPWVEESLVCLDPPRQGWLFDEHIDLWVDYMWHVRPNDANWAMVVKLPISHEEFPIILDPEEDTPILGQCALGHFSNLVASSNLYASGLSALMIEIDLLNSGIMNVEHEL